MSNEPIKNPAAVSLGSLGGKAGRGKSKARTTEQARAAAKAMWAKRKSRYQIHRNRMHGTWCIHERTVGLERTISCWGTRKDAAAILRALRDAERGEKAG